MEFKACPECYARNKLKRRTCWKCGHLFMQHEPVGTYYVPSHSVVWNAIMSFLTNSR